MILCCGEALIDMIPAPTASGSDGFVPHSGGAIFNTAIALGRLGIEAGMLTGLSTDIFGQQLEASLTASHVDTRHVIKSARPTTLAFVQLTDGQARYSFYDENTAGRMIAATDLPSIDPAVSALYFGGISLACEPGAETYAALLEREAGGRAVMLDPNIRSQFIADADVYRARIERMISMADIVKVSDEDLEWIVPQPSEMDEKALALLGQGPKVVIVTFGGTGAKGYLAGGETVSVQAQRVEVVDTVGAGDTFNAGVLAHLEQSGTLDKASLGTLSGAQLRDAMAFGARVAAITVSRAGANPPWASELGN